MESSLISLQLHLASAKETEEMEAPSASNSIIPEQPGVGNPTLITSSIVRVGVAILQDRIIHIRAAVQTELVGKDNIREDTEPVGVLLADISIGSTNGVASDTPYVANGLYCVTGVARERREIDRTALEIGTVCQLKIIRVLRAQLWISNGHIQWIGGLKIRIKELNGRTLYPPVVSRLQYITVGEFSGQVKTWNQYAVGRYCDLFVRGYQVGVDGGIFVPCTR